MIIFMSLLKMWYKFNASYFSEIHAVEYIFNEIKK